MYMGILRFNPLGRPGKLLHLALDCTAGSMTSLLKTSIQRGAEGLHDVRRRLLPEHYVVVWLPSHTRLEEGKARPTTGPVLSCAVHQLCWQECYFGVSTVYS
jgi:hypothetical protein